MKKVSLIVCFIVLILLASSCGHTTNGNLVLNFDTNENYMGFNTLPDNYTSQQAIKDNCYVIQNLQEVGGGKAWNNYLENSKNGKDSSVRIMSIYDDATYYQDLFYVEGYYRIFDSSSDDLTDHQFEYILTLDGRMPNAVKDSCFIVLTDDETLTFDDVSISLLSSNLETINSISPYKIILLV